MTERSRPKVNSEGQKELNRVEEQFKKYEENIESLTQDRMNTAPVQETEEQTKLSQRELNQKPDIYLKPVNVIFAPGQKFNEKFREEYLYRKEYVCFIYEHEEMKGEVLEKWTRPYGGLPAEFWRVPANVPVWGPRYLAEEISQMRYHRLKMIDRPTSQDAMGQYTGELVVDTIVERAKARPFKKNKTNVYMGAGDF